jgi:hypothetical protein
VALSLHGLTSEAAETGCQADRRLMHVAAEAYFAQTGADQIPATGIGHDRFEITLVESGLLRAASTYHDLDTDGALIAQGNTSC